MPDSFGARLRQRREERNIALRTIAEQTKIKLSLLEALERDDLSRWPSGIYRRAYIRAYGQAIGLCPDTIVREFLELHDDSTDVIPALQAMDPVDGSRSNGKAQTRLRDIVGAAIGSLSRRRRTIETDIAPVEPGPIPLATEASDPEPSLEVFGFAEVESAADVPVDVQVTQPVSVDADVMPQPLIFTPAPDVAPEPEPDMSTIEADTTEAPEPVAVNTWPSEMPPADPAPLAVDFTALAHLCTELGCAETADEVQPLLQEAARILDAAGVIVWIWDGISRLSPALVHGYSPKLVAQLPTVEQDADNATAEAFRLAQICTVEGTHGVPGALVVPMLTPWGCAGVLALELANRSETAPGVRAAAKIVAAVLAQLVGAQPSEVLAPVASIPTSVAETAPVLRVVR